MGGTAKYMGLMGLAQGVGNAIQEHQREWKTQRMREAEYAMQLSLQDRKIALDEASADRAHERDLQKLEYAATLEPPKDTRTTLQKNIEASGLKPGTPEYQEAIQRGTFMSKQPIVNVNTSKASPFDRELAKKDAESFVGYRSAAEDAGGMLDQLGVLKEINQLQQGGKIGEAAALVGQYFGTEAGSNMQVFVASQQDMVRQKAESLKGAMSDRDIELIEAALPKFGNDPRANIAIIEILERAAKRQIENYDAADRHVQQHGSLRGFRPVIRATSPQPKVDAASIDIDSMSADELEAEKRRRRGL